MSAGHSVRFKMIWLNLVFCLWSTQIQDTVQSLSDPIDEDSTIGAPTLNLNSLQLTLSSKLLLDINSTQSKNLKGYLGWLQQTGNITYTNCSGKDSQSESICLMYEKDMKLMITQDKSDSCGEGTLSCDKVTCHKFQWMNHIDGAMDCFIIGEEDWFGGGLSLFQRWPMQVESRSWFPMVTGDPVQHPLGDMVENLWLSSSGFLIHVEDNVPLFVSFNESGSGKLCFTQSTKKAPYEPEHKIDHELSYTICSAANIKDAYTFGLRKWIKKPKGIPEESVFRYPIWSTWARYKRDIDQKKFLELAQEIKQSSFPVSHLEIDDSWEDCYGNLEFDKGKFPDPRNMTSQVRKLGFATTLWVHPYCNVECEAYKVGKRKGFWVKDKHGNPVGVKWWNGVGAAALDVTNKKAVEWFIGRIKKLQSNYGFESFKFDGGEALFLKNFVFHDQNANLQPSIYTKLYVEIASLFGGRVEVRVGYKTQHLPIFVRMFDKCSLWNYDNGLKTLIPQALQLSIMGFFFILPDMIGGNNWDTPYGSLPHPELYIRWLQVSVFMPALQFSITPWEYDDEVVNISRKMVDIHTEYASYMIDLARKSTVTGEPIIRPLWWISPYDAEAIHTDSQFLVGEKILVAPVLEKGKQSRDIYLPEGKWKDVQRGKTYEGPQWLYNYDAPLSFLPFFIRQNESGKSLKPIHLKKENFLQNDISSKKLKDIFFKGPKKITFK